MPTPVPRRVRLSRRGEFAVATLAVAMFFATPVLAGALFRWWLL